MYLTFLLLVVLQQISKISSSYDARGTRLRRAYYPQYDSLMELANPKRTKDTIGDYDFSASASRGEQLSDLDFLTDLPLSYALSDKSSGLFRAAKSSEALSEPKQTRASRYEGLRESLLTSEMEDVFNKDRRQKLEVSYFFIYEINEMKYVIN